MYLVRKVTFSSHFTRAFSSHKKNLYSVLGVKSSATQGEIKTAYYELSKIHHPDINKGGDDSLGKFREISDAYEVLGNVSSRRLYDRGLVVGGSGTSLRQDVDVDPTTSFYRQREKRQQVPTPIDRETVYDFDAWTRAHYTAAKDRKFAAKQRHGMKVGRRSDMARRGRMDRIVLILITGILACFGFSDLIFGEAYDTNKIKSKES